MVVIPDSTSLIGSGAFQDCSSLENVTFGYNPDKTILKNISLYAHPGQKIAFVGSTGAGKTTLIVQRITNQIRQGVLRPEELVVITFTNKAAGELFERIQSSFETEEKNPKK